MNFYIQFNPRNFKLGLGFARCFSNENFRYKIHVDIAWFSLGIKFAKQRKKMFYYGNK